MTRRVGWLAGFPLLCALLGYPSPLSEGDSAATPPPFHEIEIRERMLDASLKADLRACYAQLGNIGDIWVEPEGIFIELIVQKDATGFIPPYAVEAAISGYRSHCGDWKGQKRKRRSYLKPVAALPPPAGVVIVRPDGTTQAAEACPGRYRTVSKYGWQFCLDPAQPVVIPPVWSAPIAGIPYVEAEAIFHRHKDRFASYRGVEVVLLTASGITIWLSSDVNDFRYPKCRPYNLKTLRRHIPDELDGLPVHFEHSGGGAAVYS